jgi:hypothetical protein
MLQGSTAPSLNTTSSKPQWEHQDASSLPALDRLCARGPWHASTFSALRGVKACRSANCWVMAPPRLHLAFPQLVSGIACFISGGAPWSSELPGIAREQREEDKRDAVRCQPRLALQLGSPGVRLAGRASCVLDCTWRQPHHPGVGGRRPQLYLHHTRDVTINKH